MLDMTGQAFEDRAQFLSDIHIMRPMTPMRMRLTKTTAVLDWYPEQKVLEVCLKNCITV